MQRTLLSISLLLPLLAAAEVYRWKDANGNWQFGDRAPDTQHESVEIQAPQKLGQDENVHDIHQRTLRLRESEQFKEREKQEKAKAERERRLAALEKNCREARDRLKKLQRPFVYFDDEGNEWDVPMSEVRADIAKTQKWLEENCQQ